LVENQMELHPLPPHNGPKLTIPDADDANAESCGMFLGRTPACKIPDRQVSGKQMWLWSEDNRVFIHVIVNGALRRNGGTQWEVLGSGTTRQLYAGDQLAVKWTSDGAGYIYFVQRSSAVIGSVQQEPVATDRHVAYRPPPVVAAAAGPPAKRARTDDSLQSYCILLMVE
jgi:hypothetical protein